MQQYSRKMLAAILLELGKELVIDQVSLPEKLEPGQVLVKVKFSGICGSQIGEIDGIKGNDPYLPHLLGHEGAGVVVETGPGVSYIQVGDHVVMHWRKGNSIDAPPPIYSWQGKPLNAGFITTFNEYAVVSENRLTPIPQNFDLKIASLFGCAVTTGLGVINNNAELKIGESIVIFGAGGIGINIIQGAAMVSAHPIVAIDLFDNKLDLATSFGATHVINAKKVDPVDEVKKILGPQGADVVVDNTGNTEIIAQAYGLTKPRGRTILVGVPKAGDNISIFSLPLHFDKVITGSHGGESWPAEDIPRYIKLYQAGILKLDALLTDSFQLREINRAMDMMRTGQVAGRCLLEINE